MNSIETRVQLLMALIGTVMAVAILSPQLLAENPNPPPGANYPEFNPDVGWSPGDGTATPQPGKVCLAQQSCIDNNCYSPYNANFGGIQIQSLRAISQYAYRVCASPLPGTPTGPSCSQITGIKCARVALYTNIDCVPLDYSSERDIYRLNGCSTTP